MCKIVSLACSMTYGTIPGRFALQKTHGLLGLGKAKRTHRLS